MSTRKSRVLKGPGELVATREEVAWYVEQAVNRFAANPPARFVLRVWLAPLWFLGSLARDLALTMLGFGRWALTPVRRKLFERKITRHLERQRASSQA